MPVVEANTLDFYFRSRIVALGLQSALSEKAQKVGGKFVGDVLCQTFTINNFRELDHFLRLAILEAGGSLEPRSLKHCLNTMVFYAGFTVPPSKDDFWETPDHAVQLFIREEHNLDLANPSSILQLTTPKKSLFVNSPAGFPVLNNIFSASFWEWVTENFDIEKPENYYYAFDKGQLVLYDKPTLKLH